MNDEALRLLEYEEMKDLFLPHLATEAGKALLRSLRPTRNEEALRRRLKEAAEAGAILDRGGKLPLGGCRNIAPLLAAVHDTGRPLEPEELLAIRDTLECARNLALAVAAHRERHPDLDLVRLPELVGEIPGFTLLTDRIAEAVDERGKVHDSASARLAETRREIRAIRERIERRLGDLLARKDFRNCLQEATARFRSGRPVLAVKAERRGEVRGILHDVSQSGATHFVEPEEVVAEGNQLEDQLARERREVTRILWETTVKVVERERDIQTALGAMARADLAQGAAAAARAELLRLPELAENGRIRFRGARHPILQLLKGRDGVVPVDLRLLDDFFMLIVTGPNTGGKTVTLKTLGLLLLMAQSGLPVPASEAEFVPLEDVFVDIGDEQSLQQSLSTFSGHVKRIARFLESAGERTLVLLDELGAGTDPAEGAALGRSLMDYLYERRVPTVVTTHLGILKTYAFTHRGASNASVEFDVETLSPTFRLLLGTAGASNALVIAERLGVPSAVIGRARSLVTPGEKASQEVLEKAQQIRSEAERRLREAESYREDSRELRRKAEGEAREAEERKLHVEREAEDEMDAALRRIRGLVRDYAKELANAPKPFGPKAREMLERAEEEIRATPLARRREEFALSLHRGDEVYVPRLKEKLRVHQVKKKDRVLVLIRGNIRLEVAFDDVTWSL